jgi:hypothetical protein
MQYGFTSWNEAPDRDTPSQATRLESFGLGRTFTDWMFCPDLDTPRRLNTGRPSRPEEFHLEPLTDPDVNLSIYPARII